MSITRHNGKKDFEDRFGYQESGTFCNGTKLEYLMFALTIGVMVGGVLFINAAILEPAQHDIQFALFLAICSALVNGVWICLMIILANMFMTGYKCSYSCDKEKAVIKTPVKTRTIYYSEVIGIEHDELTLLGKVRGYAVTIHTTNGDFRYRPVFSNRYSAVNFEHTPFGIIADRADALREKTSPAPIPVIERFSEDIKAAQIRRYEAPEIRGPVFPVGKQQEPFPENAAPVSPNAEKPLSVSAAPEQMPAVSIGLTAENAIARLNAELAASQEQDTAPPKPPSPSAELTARLSPVVDSRNYRFDETEEKKQLVSTGFMFVERKSDFVAKWVVFSVGVPVVLVLAVNLLFSFPTGNFIIVAYSAAWFVAALVIWITALRFSRTGQRLTYKANGEEMRIYGKKGKLEESFIYSDVVSIEHRPYKFLTLMCGYKVTITTKYKTVVYKWLFPDNYKFLDFNKSPFRIIIDRMPGGSEYDAWD